jgi:hypothetical protein
MASRFTSYQADAGAVAVVVHVADALDPLFVHQVRHALVQLHGLVYLVGDLGDDDGLAPGLGVFFDVAFATQHDAATAGLVRFAHALRTVNDAPRGEVRALDVLHQARQCRCPCCRYRP